MGAKLIYRLAFYGAVLAGLSSCPEYQSHNTQSSLSAKISKPETKRKTLRDLIFINSKKEAIKLYNPFADVFKALGFED